MGKTLLVLFVICGFASLQLGCGGGGGKNGTSITVQTPVPAGQPTFSHVVLVVEENHSYSEVIGNSSMPYLNSWPRNTDSPRSILLTGIPPIPTTLCLRPAFRRRSTTISQATISDDNVVRELVKAGKTWKSYTQSLPSHGYLGANSGFYLRRHNPFTYLSDVQNDASQAANIVPFTQFATDLANDALPQYSFISLNTMDDAHNGTLAEADAGLQTNIAPFFARGHKLLTHPFSFLVPGESERTE